MSTLTAREEVLFRIAKGALPEILFADDTSQQEVLAAFAKQLAPVWDELELKLQDTLIGSASATALDQHAKDRGTRRRVDESDAALIYRLRFMLEDSVTLAGLLVKINAILEQYAVTVPAGYPAVAELRRDRMFLGAGQGVQIENVAAASIADAETFSIGGAIYEFNKTGGITSGNIEVDISGATTASDVAAVVAATLEDRYPTLVVQDASTVVVRRAVGALSDTVADAGFSITRQASYLNRGFRLTGVSRAATVIVVMLPYGTPAECAESVAEALRQAKAGGVKVIVERRLNP